jgi:diadenosine tetraphosphate (Ap4A) HIT family hydrolase
MDCVFCRIRDGEPASTQSVPHFHIHLIPRWLGDGKGFDWTLVPGDPERIRAAAQRIRAAL